MAVLNAISTKLVKRFAVTIDEQSTLSVPHNRKRGKFLAVLCFLSNAVSTGAF